MSVQNFGWYNDEIKEGLDVNFHLDYDGTKAIISGISLNGKGRGNLPVSPEIRMDNGEHVFYREFEVTENGKVVKKYECFNDKMSKGIIKKIYEIAAKEIPNFEK